MYCVPQSKMYYMINAIVLSTTQRTLVIEYRGSNVSAPVSLILLDKLIKR